MSQERKDIDRKGMEAPQWCVQGCEDSPEVMEVYLVYTGGLRQLDLIARRIAFGKKKGHMI